MTQLAHETPEAVALAARLKLTWRERSMLDVNLFAQYEKDAYVAVLRAGGRHCKALAIEATGFCRMTVEKHLREDVAFREAAETACDSWRSELTARLVKEAREGHEDVIYFKDQPIGKRKVLETQLRTQLLKTDANYSDRSEVDVKMTGGVMVVPQPLTKQDWDNLFPAPAGAVDDDSTEDDGEL